MLRKSQSKKSGSLNSKSIKSMKSIKSSARRIVDSESEKYSDAYDEGAGKSARSTPN